MLLFYAFSDQPVQNSQPSKESTGSRKDTKYKLLYVSKRRGQHDSSSASVDLSVKCVTTKSCPTHFQNEPPQESSSALLAPNSNADASANGNVQFFDRDVVKYSSGKSKSLKRFSGRSNSKTKAPVTIL